jgi:hypothetical protein
MFGHLEEIYRSSLSDMRKTLLATRSEVTDLKKQCDILKQNRDSSRRVLSIVFPKTLTDQLAALAREVQFTLSFVFFLITDNFSPEKLIIAGDANVTQVLQPIPEDIRLQIFQCSHLYNDLWTLLRRCPLSFLPYFKFDYFVISDENGTKNLRPSFAAFLKDVVLHPDHYWSLVHEFLSGCTEFMSFVQPCRVPSAVVAEGANQSADNIVHVVQHLIFHSVRNSLIKNQGVTYHESQTSSFEYFWLDRLLDVLQHVDSVTLETSVEFYELVAFVTRQPTMLLRSQQPTQDSSANVSLGLVQKRPVSSSSAVSDSKSLMIELGNSAMKKLEDLAGKIMFPFQTAFEVNTIEQQEEEVGSDQHTNLISMQDHESEYPDWYCESETERDDGGEYESDSHPEEESFDDQDDVGEISDSSYSSVDRPTIRRKSPVKPKIPHSESKPQNTPNPTNTTTIQKPQYSSKKGVLPMCGQFEMSNLQRDAADRLSTDRHWLPPFIDVDRHFVVLTDTEKQKLPESFHELGWHIEERWLVCMQCCCFIRATTLSNLYSHLRSSGHSHGRVPQTKGRYVRFFWKSQLDRWNQISTNRGVPRQPSLVTYLGDDKQYQLNRKIGGLIVTDGLMCTVKSHDGSCCGWATSKKSTLQMHMNSHKLKFNAENSRKYLVPVKLQKPFQCSTSIPIRNEQNNV